MAQQAIARPDWFRGGPGVPMTYEEWLELQDEDMYSEWVDGEGFWYMPASDRHQAIKGFLYVLFWLFCRRSGLAVVRDAPLEMRLDTAAREPDILVLRNEHLDRLEATRLRGGADLIVELVSKDSTRRDRVDKRREYEAAGIPEYWIVDTRLGREVAEFLRLGSSGRYESIEPDREGHIRSEVLPGFSFDPGWLWQEPEPDPHELLATMEARLP